MLVLAIDQVLDFARRVLSITGDADLARARARFDAAYPDAADLRDVVAHLDEYAVGEGRRQKGTLPGLINEENLAPFISWGNDGGTVLNLGGDQLNLRRATAAPVELAEVVERVRARHLERVERAANEALRRRFGLPPE